jgi:hypothetical protein
MRVLIDLHRILVYREEEVYGEAQLRRNETGPRVTFCWHTVPPAEQRQTERLSGGGKLGKLRMFELDTQVSSGELASSLDGYLVVTADQEAARRAALELRMCCWNRTLGRVAQEQGQDSYQRMQRTIDDELLAGHSRMYPSPESP